MDNIVFLRPNLIENSSGRGTPVRNRRRLRDGRRKSNLRLIAEAGRLAQCVRLLASINGQERPILDNLTYRDELQFTRNLESALKLLKRFAEELGLDGEQKDYQSQKSTGSGN